MREDTNFKGSDLSCPSIYFLFYGNYPELRIFRLISGNLLFRQGREGVKWELGL